VNPLRGHRRRKLDIEKALQLTSAKELKRAAIEAETRNVDIAIVNELYRRYYVALEKGK
jgi:hypothetical protein